MEKETLKSLRAKAKDLRSKVSSAPLSKATPDQLRSEISMLERAVKADEKVQARKALRLSAEASTKPSVKEATVVAPAQKKKITDLKVKAVAPLIQKTSERERELIKREKELAKREKMMKSQIREDSSESDDY